jgi:hypothetical protein
MLQLSRSAAKTNSNILAFLVGMQILNVHNPMRVCLEMTIAAFYPVYMYIFLSHHRTSSAYAGYAAAGIQVTVKPPGQIKFPLFAFTSKGKDT